MRAAVRPLLFFALLCAFTAVAHSQPESTTDLTAIGGTNYLGWSKGSPSATVGGVDVIAIDKAILGYTCTKIVIRVIDDATGATLDTITINNPGSPATASFTGLGNNRRVRIQVDATFQNGNLFEALQITGTVTTQ